MGNSCHVVLGPETCPHRLRRLIEGLGNGRHGGDAPVGSLAIELATVQRIPVSWQTIRRQLLPLEAELEEETDYGT